MDFEALLKGRDCECGMQHRCAIEHIFIGKNANKRVGEMIGDYHHILLVADTNTYAVCGEEIKAQIGDRLEGVKIFVREGLMLPDEVACDELRACLTEETDLIVGVGSGVVQDVCKYVTFEAKLPYHIVATAPSMDGYASTSAAMIFGGMKATFTTHVPKVIYGDIDVLANSPMDMIRSGYGDILGKCSCLSDWKLSVVVRGEFFCPYIHDLVHDMLLKTRPLGKQLQARDPEAIKTLMESIVGVGIAMAFAGNSRPASGSEHHLSHYFEIVSLINREPYFMHGTDVAYSTIYSQRLREELLALSAPVRKEKIAREEWEKQIRKIYTVIADSVIAQQDRLGFYREDRFPVYEAKWAEICAAMREAPSLDEMMGYLESIGLDIKKCDALYGEEKIQNGLRFAKDLKDRYTVLWLHDDLLRA